jgi:hypothetical protein
MDISPFSSSGRFLNGNRHINFCSISTAFIVKIFALSIWAANA